MTINNNNNRRLIGKSMDSECHNMDDFDDGFFNKYCSVETTLREHNTCASFSKQLLAYKEYGGGIKYSLHAADNSTTRMDVTDLHSRETLKSVWHIQCTILVTLIAFALARVVRHKYVTPGNDTKMCWPHMFILEFFLISVPVVISVNILNPYVEYICAIAFILLLFKVLHSKCLQSASEREFEFGRRPALFTLMRATTNLLTALCILAIDFQSFPKRFRKSRSYGAGLMDTGIGLFVCTMAMVSSRPKKLSDFRKSLFTVTCMLVLGSARTVVIRAINYKQDEHEYGVHLNAFFTLGFTKLFATLLLFFVKKDWQLLPLGLGMLTLHEYTLQSGMSSFVIDPELQRTNFLLANREGICSLPGFIALYIFSQYFGNWIKAKNILNYKEITKKLLHLCFVSLNLWLLLIVGIFYIGIARVTCNTSYVIWMMAIIVTMCSLYMFIFHIILDTLYPFIGNNDLDAITLPTVNKPLESLPNTMVYSKIPIIIEAINFNGLLYFLLANILTGLVNIFLKPKQRTNLESVFILLNYMLLTSGIAGLLYRFKIRIA